MKQGIKNGGNRFTGVPLYQLRNHSLTQTATFPSFLIVCDFTFRDLSQHAKLERILFININFNSDLFERIPLETALLEIKAKKELFLKCHEQICPSDNTGDFTSTSFWIFIFFHSMDDFTRFVFDTVSDAFVIANQNSHVEFISSSFACLLGFSKIALTKSTIKNIFEGTKFSALVSECLETQQVLKDKRLRLSLQFRSPIDVFASLHPYKPENTTIGKALVIFRKCTVEESERLRWMELAEEECRIFGGIFEWDEEKDDVRHRFLHTGSNTQMIRIHYF